MSQTTRARTTRQPGDASRPRDDASRPRGDASPGTTARASVRELIGELSALEDALREAGASVGTRERERLLLAREDVVIAELRRRGEQPAAALAPGGGDGRSGAVHAGTADPDAGGVGDGAEGEEAG